MPAGRAAPYLCLAISACAVLAAADHELRGTADTSTLLVGADDGVGAALDAALDEDKPDPPPQPLTVGAQVVALAISGLVVAWYFAVHHVCRGEILRRLHEAMEFHRFYVGIKAATKASKGMLHFKDPMQELIYVRSNSKALCNRLRVVCVILLVHTLINAFSSFTIQGKFHWNPSIQSYWNTSAGFLYNMAGFALASLAALMYFMTFSNSFRRSDHIESFVVSWLMLVNLTAGIFFNRWFISRMCGSDPELLFLSYGTDEDYVYGVLGAVIYLCTYTELRFIFVVPFSAMLPVQYLVLTALLGSAEAELRKEFHKHRNLLKHHKTPYDPFEHVAKEAFVMFAVVALVAWGKFLKERKARSDFLTIYKSFQMIQQLGGTEGDMSQTACNSALGKARSALNKAILGMESLSASPEVFSLGLSQKILQLKRHAEFTKMTLTRVDKLFEVSVNDALRNISLEGEGANVYKDFIHANMKGTSEMAVLQHQKSWKAPTVVKKGPPTPRPSFESVEVGSAAALAEGWGSRWNFSALDLARQTGGMSCLYAGERALVDSSYFEPLQVDPETLRAWTRHIHGRYLRNGYHNEAHAAQVCHFCGWFIKQTGLFLKADCVQVCSLMVASLAHDVGHIGRTNLFCTKVGHSFSLIWNDVSILENMHTATCFAVMHGDADLMECMDTASRMHFRKNIVRFILATDIKEHHACLVRLKGRMEDDNFLAMPDGQCEDDSPQDLHAKFDEDVIAAGEMIMKTSDIGQGMASWRQHREWSYRILVEFFEQGDEERELGIPVSPLCDRGTYDIVGGQTFFIDCLCRDCFNLLARFADEGSKGREALEDCLKLGDENKNHWKAEAEFDPRTHSMESVADAFGEIQPEVTYPYPFEKQKVPLRPVSTEENLKFIAQFFVGMHCGEGSYRTSRMSQ